MLRARITSKGQITVPKVVRERIGVQAGDALEFRFVSDHLEVVPIRRRRLAEFRGIFRVDRELDIGQERALYRASRASRALTEDSHPGRDE